MPDFRLLAELRAVPPREDRDMLEALRRWLRDPSPERPDVFRWETIATLDRRANVRDV